MALLWFAEFDDFTNIDRLVVNLSYVCEIKKYGYVWYSFHSVYHSLILIVWQNRYRPSFDPFCSQQHPPQDNFIFRRDWSKGCLNHPLDLCGCSHNWELISLEKVNPMAGMYLLRKGYSCNSCWFLDARIANALYVSAQFFAKPFRTVEW